ncbi:MAG: hypothetical protein Ct9H300mP1_33560 [Planctomycetaceae bacterium]|nr:MAG: hypothetical protein Ct9H300mP1_33560 [Planctomycetaceae bacterium]
MSQPFDCHAVTPALREVDRKSGEFWVPNPWDFANRRENLSAYERNGVFLNLGATGSPTSDTPRQPTATATAVARWGCDITGDGRPELFVRQAGGGPLRIYRNLFPAAGWLTVSLVGTASNRQGIGARVVAHLGDRVVRRELYPVSTSSRRLPHG